MKATLVGGAYGNGQSQAGKRVRKQRCGVQQRRNGKGTEMASSCLSRPFEKRNYFSKLGLQRPPPPPPPSGLHPDTLSTVTSENI